MTRRALIVWATIVAIWLVAGLASTGCDTAGQCAGMVTLVLLVGLAGAVVILVISWVARGRRA